METNELRRVSTSERLFWGRLFQTFMISETMIFTNFSFLTVTNYSFILLLHNVDKVTVNDEDKCTMEQIYCLSNWLTGCEICVYLNWYPGSRLLTNDLESCPLLACENLLWSLRLVVKSTFELVPSSALLSWKRNSTFQKFIMFKNS